MVSENKKQDPRDLTASENEEKTLNFEAAKDMTIGQVVRKQKEIQDGVEEDDNILDRYIKQHREDIEARKYDTVADRAVSDEEVITEVIPDTIFSETVTGVSTVGYEEQVAFTEGSGKQEELLSSGRTSRELASDLQIYKVEKSQSVETAQDKFPQFDDMDEIEEIGTNKKVFIWGILAVVFVGVLATTFIWMNSSNGTTNTSSSSSTTQTSSAKSEDSNMTAFNTLYAGFFTDNSQTKLKNSEFGKLSELKAALDKIGTSSDDYKAAKAKYDALEKAIQSIQDINKQFDKEVIVDGELDATATAKSDATFAVVTTGFSAVDSLLTSAINMGRTQLLDTPSSSVEQTESASTTIAQPSALEPANQAASSGYITGAITTDTSIYGIETPAGITLQREMSRVPYNQAAIDDVNNEAWNFTPGVLERIIAVSHERGYVVGNQYILEKVNIINGNGYYNLFRPDGVYLFSINCKTGYFVGNGAGYADDLDY